MTYEAHVYCCVERVELCRGVDGEGPRQLREDEDVCELCLRRALSDYCPVDWCCVMMQPW
jgi:hypothetical protein